MAEIPSNIICADLFCEHFDGFSIGSNDLTQLTYGVDRDGSKLIPIAKEYKYTTNSESIRRSLTHLIKTAHDFKKKVGICGQAPSDDPDFLRFLVREGIDSISLNFDTFARGRINTWRTEIIETKLEADNKTKSYQFLNKCDNLIERIRIPKGKLHNMVRKQGKKVNTKLMKSTEEFNKIFNNIQDTTYEFVKEIDQGGIEKFDNFFEKYSNQIKDFELRNPSLRREIREFGIY